jgi:hypothetical protein
VGYKKVLRIAIAAGGRHSVVANALQWNYECCGQKGKVEKRETEFSRRKLKFNDALILSPTR